MDEKRMFAAPAGEKKRWEPMRVTDMGHVSQVVQLGGGKLSAAGGDPGEPRKQKPSG